MDIQGFFDTATHTISYLVADPVTKRCAIIDSVLDYDPKSGRTSTRQADRIIERVRELDLSVDWILETHVHADHLSAAPYLKQQLGGKTAIGSHLPVVQAVFGNLFNAGPDFATDGRQFDHLLQSDETISIGQISCTAWHTPGHTPACVSYLISDGQRQVVFVGDTLFMPDTGTARCDFPGGDPRILFQSIQRILALPPETDLYLCHDYPPDDRPVTFSTTVQATRDRNIHVRDGISEAQFVTMRNERDATLEMPVLILPAVQVNMRCGNFPEPESNGIRYLKIPINAV